MIPVAPWAASRCAAAWLAGMCLVLLLAPAAVQGQGDHKRVLVMHSYGQNFSPYDEFAVSMQQELAKLSPADIEFFGVSLETARFVDTKTEKPLVDYLSSLFDETDFDLVISLGGPAMRFCLAHHESLFGSTPLLVTAVVHRLLSEQPIDPGVATVTVRLDFLAVVAGMRELFPTTEHIVVVLGSSAHERAWVEELRREFRPLEDRLRFTFLYGLPAHEMREHVANLGPDTAVLYVIVIVDGEGVPQQEDRALRNLRSVTAAPIFGLFDNQLGNGVVGGRMVSVAESSGEAAVAALRILGGEPPAEVRPEPLAAGSPVYDFRELESWGIPESRLPPGSSIVHRPASVLEEYTAPVIVVVSALVLQTTLIAGLLLNRKRRQRAEAEALSLGRRLMSAHEEERRRLAQDLHDDLSQRLAKVAIEASQINSFCEGTRAETVAEQMRADLASLADDVHALSYRIHPSVLEDLGFCEALRVEAEQFSARVSTPAELHTCECRVDLPRRESLALFRIAQEALHNVERHARASRVQVWVVTKNRGLQLTVKDDGVGFSPERPRGHPSLGLDSMRERAHAVEGTLEVESTPGQGTTVRAWVPSERAAP